MQTDLYPLCFTPIYKEKVWGGRRISQLDRSLPGDPDTPIGESWELADLGASSPSGGGGGAERSVIANGPLAGKSLHEVVEQFGETMLGRLRLTGSGDFPILLKYLDAKENLSVQVHPSPEYAAAHPDAHLKSEAWYIVDCEPGAVIYKGIQQGVTPSQFQEAIASQSTEAVEAMMIRVPVKPGDCHYLPSGTCHALGAGVLVAEVQTPSDTTYRVFDWGRTDRELHIEQAMQCIDFGPPDVSAFETRTHIAGMFTTVSRLVLCDHFRIEKVRMLEGYEQEVPYDQPALWMVLQGGGMIRADGSISAPGASRKARETDVTFKRGDTLLLPAGMKDPHVRLDTDTVWLEVTFPQAYPEQLA